MVVLTGGGIASGKLGPISFTTCDRKKTVHVGQIVKEKGPLEKKKTVSSFDSIRVLGCKMRLPRFSFLLLCGFVKSADLTFP